MAESDRILDRELSRAATTEVRQVGAPLLREVVDYGIAAFQRCSATATGLDTPLGVLFPFLHFVEMLDATEVLLDVAAVAPGHVTLRSAFEAELQFEYVASAETERRGAAYVVAEVHRRIDLVDRFDPETAKGKNVAATMANDRIGAGITIPIFPDLEEKRTRLQSILKKPHLAEAAQEYERTRTATGRHPPFYHLWGGPANIEQLARVVGRSGQYEVLYRQWSRTAHAADLSRQLSALDGEPALARFRNGVGLDTAYTLAISLGLGAIRLLLRTYRPQELVPTFRNWYLERIGPGFTRLSPSLANEQAV